MPALALAKLWKPLSIAALIVAVSAYRGVLIHQRDAAASLARTREDAQARAGAQAMAAAAHRAVALAHAPVEPGCAAAIRWGNEQAAELGRW